MILLDTNVVSAMMAPRPPESVLAWMDDQRTEDLHLSTITIAEVGYGLWALPRGKRRRELEDRFERFVARGFEQRVLAFDIAAAREYGAIMADRRSLGRPLAALDGQIAAIARSGNLALATRNVRDFEDCGLVLVNPFD